MDKASTATTMPVSPTDEAPLIQPTDLEDLTTLQTSSRHSHKSSNSNGSKRSEPKQGWLEDDHDADAKTTPRSPSICVLRWTNLIAYLLNVLVTYGVGVGGAFGGKTNAEISAQYPSLVTPAGWAFGIWGLIFLMQAIWVVLPFFLASSGNDWVQYPHVVGYKYLCVVGLQSLWTLVFSQEWIGLSAMVMTALLAVLWWTTAGLIRVMDQRIIGDVPDEEESRRWWRWRIKCTYFLWVWPFMLHTGWITAATAVNWNVVLVFLDTGTGLQFCGAVLGLLVLCMVSLGVLWRRVDRTIPLVVAWALLGVAVELTDPPTRLVNRFEDDNNTHTIVWTKWSATVLCVLIVLLTVIWHREDV